MFGMFKKSVSASLAVAKPVLNKVGAAMRSTSIVPALMLAVLLVVGHKASATVTLPDLGIETDDYITALVTYASTFLGTVLTGWFAFIGIKMFTRWVKGLIANA
jgi:fructose-specific phosphotransferase system IIC component